MVDFRENPQIKGFLLWILFSLIIFVVINPFEVAIWRDRAYLIYMAQSVSRGVDLYENTPLGYTPLAPLIAGYIMRFVHLLSGEASTIMVARVAGIILHALITGSLFVLAFEILKEKRLAHLVGLLFLSFTFILDVSSTNLEPKLLALFFEIWGIYAAIRSRWLISTLWLSLAAMCWQPMALNCILIIPFYFYVEGWKAKSFINLWKLVLGVFLGLLPCLIYLYATNDWLDFWNQAVMRKVAYEGETVFEAPFQWIIKLLTARFVLQAPIFLLAALGVMKALYGLINKRVESRQSTSWIFLLILCLGWGLFNSLEFQGELDSMPMIPLLLIFAVFALKSILQRLSKKGFIIVYVLAIIYAFFDLTLPKKGISYSEQQALFSQLERTYGDAFVINFEEYYVIREMPMPTRYIRLGLFEDYSIDQLEAMGCDGLIEKVKEQKPKAIISRVVNGEGLSSIGSCGQQIIDELGKGEKSIFEVAQDNNRHLVSIPTMARYEVYLTDLMSETNLEDK